jgi:hypothetical protein
MAKVQSISRKTAGRLARPTLVHLFLIALTGIDPLVMCDASFDASSMRFADVRKLEGRLAVRQ